MSPEVLAQLCLLAPLAAFFIAFVGLRHHHRAAAGVVLAAGLVTLVSSLGLVAGGVPTQAVYGYEWLVIGSIQVDFGVLLDGKTLIMGAVVALITLCIQIYSLGYMATDPGKGRFFAFLALFEWAMLTFVYSSSLLQTFICWELVGLASFFLIGFWYEKPSAVAAAKKAFLMTRIGDVGLLIGLILLFDAAGSLDVVSINGVFDPAGAPASIPAGRIELIAALLFVGIVGKSAQFPLHTWLPDAMEGPTPVSALLHTPTMVAAGVFLFARFHGLFLDAPDTSTLVLAIATFTALLSSTMAMVAKDMKKVLAYSSISQLGFMLMGLAAGNLFAGFFHLTTHAFFKALLFLCAGAFIHHAGTIDMVAIGRKGARELRLTTAALFVGAGALAGIPPLAGFFSKEHIIGALHGDGYTSFMIGAYLAAFLTAYYTFRMVFFIVFPNENSEATPDEEADVHSHDEHDSHGVPWTMKAPMVVLAVGAIGAGFAGDHIAELLGLGEIHHPSIGEMAPAVAVALGGVLLAWLDFGRKGARQLGFISKFPAVQTLFAGGWYIDEFYRRVFVRLAQGIARVFYGVETLGLDGGTDKLGHLTRDAGEQVARGHRGRLPIYVGTAIALLAGILLYVGAR